MASRCFSPSAAAPDPTLFTPPTRPSSLLITSGTTSIPWRKFASSRPLGDAVLDGIDFDIETGDNTQHWGDLGGALKGYNQQLILSAAPQCPSLDYGPLSNAISTGLFDYVWLQFYNSGDCMYSNGNTNNLLSSWNQWNNVQAGKVFLGVPASEAAAPSGGFIPSDVMTAQVLPNIKGSAN